MNVCVGWGGGGELPGIWGGGAGGYPAGAWRVSSAFSEGKPSLYKNMALPFAFMCKRFV